MTPTPKTEPVLTATLLAPVVVWALAYFGLQVDLLLATQIAGVVLAVGSIVARSRVRTKATLPDPMAVKPPPSAAGLLHHGRHRPPKAPPPTAP